jgi:NAD(P)-dependent dehydrogenase (short-subunit alcohol dehydrogenase family)
VTYLPSFRLDQRVAVVTGASSGLGEHLALALAEAGADVALVARNGSALKTVAAKVAHMGRRSLVVPADVTRADDIAHIVASTEAELGQIDILVNNAGTNIQQSFLDVTHEAWDEIMHLNLRSAFFMAQAVAKSMVVRQVRGRIINMSSQMAEVGFFKRSVYCASKAGVVGMTRAMAIELAEHGIRVNALGPTFIDSPLARKMFDDVDIANEVLKRIPIGRLGTLKEVAAAVLFLASDGADLITGHHLLADGGWTAW